MSVKKFIESVKESLGLDEFKKSSKKKAIKKLLKKLREKQNKLTNSLDKKLEKKVIKEKKEELHIITIQIKKGEKILEELSSESK
ncbi:MAG: hypothetical protein J7J96_07505 [Sulfurimonas sp.]|nr:hypothetical protein [Sulfurimonas sp.]